MSASKFRQAGKVRWCTAVAIMMVVAIMTGCVPLDDISQSGMLLAPAPNAPQAAADLEPNDIFEQAVVTEIFDNVPVQIEGTIADASDVDVYSIGSLSAGDRVQVSIAVPEGYFFSGLWAAVGLFDATTNRLALEQNITFGATGEQVLDITVRSPTDVGYVAVAASYEYSQGQPTTSGPYLLSITLSRGTAWQPQQQQVYLAFDGASEVLFRGQELYDVPAFTGSDFGRAGTGRTEELKQIIVDTVTGRYAGYNLTFSTSDKEPPPPPYSTVYFGGRSADRLRVGDLIGSADDVDFYNVDRNDVAIVYTAIYGDVFGYMADVEGMAIAAGNVGAHELGHLLGLSHTQGGGSDLMGSYHSGQWLFRPQRLVASSLLEFPIGVQDPYVLLLDTLGYTPSDESETVAGYTILSDDVPAEPVDDTSPSVYCGYCAEHTHNEQ